MKLTDNDIKYNMFRFNDNEIRSAIKFQKKHANKCRATKFKIEFAGTGIGTAIKVKCCSCKATKDISDYNSW
jgi:hypothetical protein